jgi:N-acyl-D-amino-acid deacylase
MPTLSAGSIPVAHRYPIHSVVCTCLGIIAVTLPVSLAWAVTKSAAYSVILRGGTVYDGSGGVPYRADVGIRGDRIAVIAPHLKGRGNREIDVAGRAVAPGFINMLAHPEESLLVDGRAQSDLRQGVTLEVVGEVSMGPLTPKMKDLMTARQGDIKYEINWSTLGEYLDGLHTKGISVNVASFVSAATVRENVLGEVDVQPTPEQLAQMRALVRQAMEEGALGVTTMLIYSPAGYAKTPELIALAQESAACGGLYSAHMRSEGDRIVEAVQETIDIARASGGPAEIYHLKMAGRENWGKLTQVLGMIEAARASGIRITADMYNYVAGATGFDAYMPPWVQDGGLEAWILHLKEPALRARVIAEMRDPHTSWENLGIKAGGEGMLLLAFQNPKLKPYTGKTLAEVARLRGTSIEDTAIDLVIEDGSRVGVAYFLMSEDNVRRQLQLPWVSFDSDEEAPAIEGVFLKSINHPRAFGNFARLLGRYVREEKLLTLQEAVRRLSAFPAETLSLKDRGRLKSGYFADVVVFDPLTIQDHATFEKPMQYASGVDYVLVNGEVALDKGEPTSARPGRVVRGRAFSGTAGGGCRASSKAWSWGR